MKPNTFYRGVSSKLRQSASLALQCPRNARRAEPLVREECRLRCRDNAHCDVAPSRCTSPSRQNLADSLDPLCEVPFPNFTRCRAERGTAQSRERLPHRPCPCLPSAFPAELIFQCQRNRRGEGLFPFISS